MAKFKWNAEALNRETVTISLPTGKDKEGNLILEDVTFSEFYKTNCDIFIGECTDTKITEEVPDVENEGKTALKRKPFTTVTKQQSTLINKWFAIATDGKRDAKFFATVESLISAWAYGHLVEMLFELNHINDILAVGGNYLLLPNALEISRHEGAAEAPTN